MKHLRTFMTEAEAILAEIPSVILIEQTGEVLYNRLPNGVYIQHINGSLYNAQEWAARAFANGEANGIAVFADSASFVIAKEDAASEAVSWGGYNVKISDIITSTDRNLALSDYDGKGNTEKIIAQLSGYTDSAGIIGAPAAESCARYTFPNGKTGYLPSVGEWAILTAAAEDINNALFIIGGNPISAETYWLSTQSSASSAWSQSGSNVTPYTAAKNYTYRTRAFAPLNI